MKSINTYICIASCPSCPPTLLGSWLLASPASSSLAQSPWSPWTHLERPGWLGPGQRALQPEPPPGTAFPVCCLGGDSGPAQRSGEEILLTAGGSLQRRGGRGKVKGTRAGWVRGGQIPLVA